MIKLVFIRHGESTWNKENRFTGWTDVPLSDKGVVEARKAGCVLKESGYTFDLAYTSLLTRAILTLHYVLTELDLLWIPVQKTWRLNERHYGALQGLNKSETAEKHGKKQVSIWRRSYAVPPPQLAHDDSRNPVHDPRYKDVEPGFLPLTECLKDTVQRFLPYWSKVLAPQLLEKKKLLIVAHGNSIRAAVKYLDKIHDEDIVSLNIPTGVPLVYELDDALVPLTHYYLGDQDEIAQATEQVAQQATHASPK